MPPPAPRRHRPPTLFIASLAAPPATRTALRPAVSSRPLRAASSIFVASRAPPRKKRFTPHRCVIWATAAKGASNEDDNEPAVPDRDSDAPDSPTPESTPAASTDTPSTADDPDQPLQSVALSEQPEQPEQQPQRPDWAPQWMPDVLVRIRDKPWLQLTILLPLYAVHLFLFSTKGWKFNRSLIPNEKNLFQSVGYDSVAGSVVALIFIIWRQWMSRRATTPQPNFARNLLKVDDPPWKVPRDAKRKIGQTTLLLFVAYLASGYGAVFSEQILYLLAGCGVPLTVATTRAWKVLLGHLMWVYMGINILRRLKPFFPKKGTWLKWEWKNSNWLWWAIGGYYISALFFNMADVANQLILPASLFEEETVVSKLINPENKDRMAMAIGSIGPCLSAPIFEEVLYRGFLLPALACFLPMWAAIPTSSVLFAIHHLNPTMIIPLSMLGFIWAILYAKSGNLLVTILIHAMWNSRVFLGSLLGLGPFTDFE